MTRIFIAGSNGFLGKQIANTLTVQGFDVVQWNQLDITRAISIKKIPPCDILVNCAGKTNVDWCETHASESFEVNARGVELLCKEMHARNTRLIHISSDYTFFPTNTYAEHKKLADMFVRNLEGHLIVYVAGLYGLHRDGKKCLPEWIIEKMRAGEPLSIVRDVEGSHTLVGDIASYFPRFISDGLEGEIACVGEGVHSKFDVAQAVAQTFGFEASLVTPVEQAQLLEKGIWKARRPTRVNLWEKPVKKYACKGITDGLIQLKIEMDENKYHSQS